jgi:hypothetical protein
MRGWLASLAEWRSSTVLGGFAELDIEIDKLRKLRDSYQLLTLEKRPDQISDVNHFRNTATF